MSFRVSDLSRSRLSNLRGSLRTFRIYERFRLCDLCQKYEVILLCAGAIIGGLQVDESCTFTNDTSFLLGLRKR